MNELHKALSNLEKELERLNESSNTRKQRAMQDFVSITNNISHNLQKVWDTAWQRQNLIDRQCNARVFHGPLHEEYHRVNSLLENDFNNFFSSIENILNRFTTLVIELLPRDDTRGIEHAGFSRFVRTIKKGTFTNPSLCQIKKIIEIGGDEIDKTISAYRDTKISHVSKYFSTGFFSTGDGGIQRGHDERKNSESNTGSMNAPDRNRIPPICELKSPDGKHKLYYLHVEADPSIRAKSLLEKGERMGTTSDNDSGHFIDYGPHMHVFTTPLVPPAPLGQNIDFSPDPENAAIKVIDFFARILKCIP